ncbi:MAG TPA: hypothetical protein VMI94_21600 [Bryobacteraceae bacterium]|nr:hypothetical protein [Bryobacteraceae bacterium]
MGTLSIGTGNLVWQYPQRPDGVFELRVDGAELGWLRFENQPGADSIAELDGQRWSLRHTKGLLPRVTVRRENSNEPVAEFVPGLTGGGTVTFTAGPRYCWNRSKIWSPTWCFRRLGEGQGSSICVSQESGPLHNGGKVRICGNAAGLPEAPVLLLVAWYLRVLAFEKLAENIPATS